MKRRGIWVFFILLWLMIGIGGRLAQISLGEEYVSAAQRQSLFTLEVDRPRGTVYDRNGQPVTNRQTVYKTALTATPQVITAVYDCFEGEQRDRILAQLSVRMPLVVLSDRVIPAQGARSFACKNAAPVTQPAAHLMGYLDAAGEQGVSGLQQAFDSLLACRVPTTVTYACDATGGALPGAETVVVQDEREYEKGLLTTLDLTCQLAAEQALTEVEKGAVIIQKAGSGEILAAASVPTFSPADLSAALNDPDGPFLNRAFSAYNVGSVFKLCVAAAALEQGISPDRTYTCTGSIACGQVFHCHREEGHGTLTMAQAMAESCNPYFIDLAQEVGAEAVAGMAEKLGFGTGVTFAQGVFSDAGSLPDTAELQSSPAALANFAIGQGALMATPLQINTMTSAIADGGILFEPALILGSRDENGTVTPQKNRPGNRVMRSETAALLREMMGLVMREGTGASGASVWVESGGKTATAQTGILDADGSFQTQAWLTGFFPLDQPAYTITVLVEGGASGGRDAAPVFKAVCEAIFGA